MLAKRAEGRCITEAKCACSAETLSFHTCSVYSGENCIDSIPQGKKRHSNIETINFENCSTVEGIIGIQNVKSAVVNIHQ